MADWSIEYSTTPVAVVGGHGVLSVKNPDGQVVRSYEGLATSITGEIQAIGKNVADNIKAYSFNGKGPNYTEEGAQVLFSGTLAEINSMVAAADIARDEINSLDIGYPIMGVMPTSRSIGISNSNAVISTLAVAMGLKAPMSITTRAIPGAGVILLDEEALLRARATLDQSNLPSTSHCFVAGTSILVADGIEREIESLVPGSLVIAFDQMGVLLPGSVTRIFHGVTNPNG